MLSCIMLDGYYDVDLTRLGARGDWAERIRPYAGFGVGMAIVDLDADITLAGVPVGQIKGTGTEFAWQFALGSAYSFSERWAGTAGYTVLDVGATVHNVMLGVRHTF